MRHGLGWMLALGLGGALVAGCRQGQESQQVGRFNEPIHQKYQSPAGAASDTAQGGSGEAGVKMDEGWEKHESKTPEGSEHTPGPYATHRAQPLPRERQDAPLGVGAGTDTARKMAQDQLESD